MRFTKSKNRFNDGSTGFRQGVSDLKTVTSIYILAIIANSSILTYFEEKLSFFESLYLTIVTAASVGYGDYYPETIEGKVTISIFIVTTTILLLAIVMALIVDLFIEKRHLMITGKWRWKLRDHILIMGGPMMHAEEFYCKLARQIRNTDKLKDSEILIATNAFPNGMPRKLADYGVSISSTSLTTMQCLDETGVNEAAQIIILAEKSSDPVSDSRTFDLLSRIKGYGTTARVVAECVNDENRQRFKHAGADFIIRPLRAYPELITRCIAHPGSERVIEGFFTEKGHKIQRVNTSISHLLWSDILRHFADKNSGTPIGYLSTSNEIKVSPSNLQEVSAKALYILTGDDTEAKYEQVIKGLHRATLKEKQNTIE